MNSDSPIKNNLSDVLMLLLKALVLDGAQEPGQALILNNDLIRRAQGYDLEMTVVTGQYTALRCVEGKDPKTSKIILPHGRSPLVL